MPLKDVPVSSKRCINCNAILFEGNIQQGIIDIDCRKCKTKNVFIAGDINAESRDSLKGQKYIPLTQQEKVELEGRFVKYCNQTRPRIF
jgi:phage FluMu protein Com